MSPSLSIGVPIDTPMLTLLQRTFELLLPQAEDLVRMLLNRCDVKDQEVADCSIRMQASKVDGVELRKDEADALEREYMRAVARLADTLGVTIYPYSERIKSMPSSGMTNVGMIGISR
jgi:hypothetical protein